MGHSVNSHNTYQKPGLGGPGDKAVMESPGPCLSQLGECHGCHRKARAGDSSDHQLNRIWTPLGDTLPGTSMRKFLDRVIEMGKLGPSVGLGSQNE